MKITKKTYYLFSAITLILFASSFLLPAGLSAASLFCDMEMAAMHGGTHSCCEFHEMDLSEGVTKKTDDPPCASQRVCSHILSKDQADFQAISQTSKEVSGTVLFQEIFVFSVAHQQPRRLNPLPVSGYSPPIFLLNSSFLN